MAELAKKEAEIVRTERIVGGKARIKGTRIRVMDIVQDYEQLGMKPDDIAYQYDLTVPQVLEALKYYYENPEEIREEMRKARMIFLEAKREGKIKSVEEL